MKRKKRSVIQSKAALIRHAALPRELIERIKAYKKILAEVEESSLEETIKDFKWDENPEIEVVIGERIAKAYQMYITKKPVTDPAARKEVFAVIVGTAMGSRPENFRHLRLLDEAQIKAIIALYNTHSNSKPRNVSQSAP